MNNKWFHIESCPVPHEKQSIAEGRAPVIERDATNQYGVHHQ